MMDRISAILLLLTISLVLNAQPTTKNIEENAGIILGKIIDAQTGKPIEYANIGLLSVGDNSIVTGAITKSNGQFFIGDIADGNYYLLVKFMGYEDYKSDNISIGKNSKRVKIGNIRISPRSEELKGIEVVGKKRSVVYKLDKKIIDAESYNSAAGGTAVDILENAPSISVDLEGNVSLRGSSSFTVFIDGRPTLLPGSQALEQIPSNQVKNIEIITNPSARYSAEGEAGIINVVTKKDLGQGTSGIVNLTGSTAKSYGADFLLSKRKNKFQWRLGGNIFKRNREGDFYQIKETIISDTTNHSKSEGIRIGRYYNTSLKGGVSFISDNTTIDFDIEGGDRGSGYVGDLEFSEQHIAGGNTFFEHGYSSYDYKDLNEDFVAGNLGITHRFNDKGHKLSGSLFGKYGSSMEYFENDLTSNSGVIDDGQRSWEEEYRVTIQGKVDYVMPINSEKGKFEAGYQFDSYVEDGDYSMNDFDKELGDFFYREDFFSAYRFKRDIHSLYTIIANQIGRFGYQIGGRGEYTHRFLGSSEEWATHTQNRLEFFPSAHFTWQVAQNDNITASYSRRTVRPRLHFLEPYVTFADSYTARTGNPSVRPEYVNSFELGYQKNINSSFFVFELFYRMKKDKIERIRTVYEANVTLDSISNVGNDYSLGAELMSTIKINDWWMLNSTANLLHYRIESDYKIPGIDDESINWQLRFSNSFELGKTTRVQLDGNYVGPSASTQGTREAFFYTNLSVRQQFFNRKLVATLTARDLLSTAQYENSQTGTGLYSYTKVKPISPLVTLTLSYRINSNQKEKKEGNSDNLFEGAEH